MNKPFMIRFPFKGRGRYANVYMHQGSLKEYHVHLIDTGIHVGLPPKIVLIKIEGVLRLAEPLNLSKSILAAIVEEIEKQQF